MDQVAFLKNIELLKSGDATIIYPTLSESILANKAAVQHFESLSNSEDKQVARDVEREEKQKPAGEAFWNRAEVKESRRVVADLGFAIK
jgi:hypothetical protein